MGLCIPYEIGGETKSMSPVFIVVRRDERLGYVVDVLEPHNPGFKDNLAKSKGFAEYARQNPCIGRIQLVRAPGLARRICICKLCLLALAADSCCPPSEYID